MYDTNDRIWSSNKVNHGGFIKFHKRLVRFFVATLIILAGITNESKGIKPSSSLPVIKLQQYSLNRAQSLSLPKIRRQDCILNITTECFKIRNQKDCGNVLLYRVKSLRLDGKA